jgi:hypothetical protein
MKWDRQEELLAGAEWVIRAKATMSALMLVVFALARWVGLLEFPFWLFAIAPLLEMSINLPHHWIMRKMKDPARVHLFTSAFDVLIITWAAYTLGDLGKLLALLLYPTIFIFSGVAMEPRNTFFFANLSFAAISALTVLESLGILPPVGSLTLALSGAERAMILAVVFPVYNFMAYFVHYLSDLLRKREAELVRGLFYDPLTGLANQDLFLERLGLALARVQSPKAAGGTALLFGVLFLDLDRRADSRGAESPV